MSKKPAARVSTKKSARNKALTVESIAPDRLDLHWAAVPGAEAYRIFCCGADEPPGDEAPLAGQPEPGYVHRGLAPATAYRYRVEARAADGATLGQLTAEGRTRPDGLVTTREGQRLTIRGDAFELEWDIRQGGELAGIRQYDGADWFPINDPAAGTVPGLTFTAQDGPVFKLAELPGTQCAIEKQTATEVIVAFTVRIADCDAGLKYHVFREGALFCELTLPRESIADDRTQGVDAEANMRRLDALTGQLGLRLAPEICAGKLAWGHFRRHYPIARAGLGRNDQVTEPDRMLPMAVVDYGRAAAGGFTNRLEFFIEDSPPRGATTRFGADQQGGFGFEWHFAGRALRDLNFTCWDMGFLRTRWGLCLGAARKGAFGQVPVSRRNNLLGARIFHASGSQAVLDGRAEHWPYNVPPVTLLRSPQTALPSDEEIRSMRRQGANVIVVHQFWMRSGGSNCEPPADYIPRDPADLKRFVDTCHRHGIRVGLYMRGVEKYALFQPYFEQFLQRDYDGLYVDWSNPHALGFQGCNELHFSAYNYFLFTRALRERVGEKGFLIGHSGAGPCLPGLACLDAYVVGEAKDQRDNLYNSPDDALHWGLASCMGTHPLSSINAPEARQAAYAAALAMSPHIRFPGDAHHMQAVWHIWNTIPMEQAVLYNSQTENLQVVHCSAPEVHTPVYRVSADLLLLVAANLGPATETTLRLDQPALGMTGSYNVSELYAGPTPADFRSQRVEISPDGALPTRRFAQYEVRGYLLKRTRA
ncbi:MAG: hypothetical protein K9N49_01200 [Candidatus Marinimicrobia bacterium]|nr:hypothetical protein [Candidatus Neomarinimicrobiota bacterium]